MGYVFKAWQFMDDNIVIMHNSVTVTVLEIMDKIVSTFSYKLKNHVHFYIRIKLVFYLDKHARPHPDSVNTLTTGSKLLAK